jgi:hypothetical protein
VGLRHRQQVVAGGAAGVEGARVEQRADLVERHAVVAVALAVDDHGATVGRVEVEVRRIVVDLPEPFGPRKPVTRPGCTTKLRSLTAAFSP